MTKECKCCTVSSLDSICEALVISVLAIDEYVCLVSLSTALNSSQLAVYSYVVVLCGVLFVNPYDVLRVCSNTGDVKILGCDNCALRRGNKYCCLLSSVEYYIVNIKSDASCVLVNVLVSNLNTTTAVGSGDRTTVHNNGLTVSVDPETVEAISLVNVYVVKSCTLLNCH